MGRGEFAHERKLQKNLEWLQGKGGGHILGGGFRRRKGKGKASWMVVEESKKEASQGEVSLHQ